MKVIMVDLDGTLFDTRKVNYLAYQEAISTYGYSIDYNYYCSYCNGRHYTDFLPKITTTEETVLLDMHRRKKEAYPKYLAEARLNTPLVDMLRLLKGEYKLALVTTASRKNTEDIIGYFKLRDLFDLIITHEDVEKCKPSPECYLKAMEFYQAIPGECIIYEDSEVGIEAAIASGANCYVVKGYN